MISRNMLLLVLLAGCRSTEPVSEAPVVEPDGMEETVATEPQQPSVPRPIQEIALGGDIALDYETLLRGAVEQRATLTVLSAGYESQPKGVLHGYRITLLDVEDPDRSPRAVLAIEPAE